MTVFERWDWPCNLERESKVNSERGTWKPALARLSMSLEIGMTLASGVTMGASSSKLKGRKRTSLARQEERSLARAKSATALELGESRLYAARSRVTGGTAGVEERGIMPGEGGGGTD